MAGFRKEVTKKELSHEEEIAARVATVIAEDFLCTQLLQAATSQEEKIRILEESNTRLNKMLGLEQI